MGLPGDSLFGNKNRKVIAMNIIESTRLFEQWLRTQTTVVRADLAFKHSEMSTDPFVFLRATFYRWAQLFPELLPDLMDAPIVLGVADDHVEQVGSWRDSEGRLIWGVNDRDEAAPVPYTNDLVRLATSARFAIELKLLGISKTEAFKAILKGYRDGLKDGIKPFVLAEENLELGRMVTSRLRSPRVFWQHVQTQLSATKPNELPESAVAALKDSLPEASLPMRLFRRRAGKGSLGRQRFVALVEFEGGLIAREVKARVQSAWFWAHPDSQKNLDKLIATFAGRNIGDPTIEETKMWSVRRLAPDCSKIDLATLRANRDEKLLMWAMGRETANFHLAGGAGAKTILAHLTGLDPGWLHDAAKTMSDATKEDFTKWCQHMRR